MPGWTRTSDPQLRRLMLYPTELRAHGIYPKYKDSSNASQYEQVQEIEKSGRQKPAEDAFLIFNLQRFDILLTIP